MTALTSKALRIAGLTRFSTVDWPGRVTATVFLQGCPWDCFYCHNPDLIDPRSPGTMTWNDIELFLERRVGLLDAVVFSGGEPTMQRALLPAMAAAHERGFEVGLHSAGAFPGLLSDALPHVDWIGLDIKASRQDYDSVTGRAGSGDRAWRSLDIVLAEQLLRAGSTRPLGYEIRTTVHPAAMDDDALDRLGSDLATAGVDTWAVQRFRDAGTRSPLPRIETARRTTTKDPSLTLDRIPADRFAHFTLR